MPNQERLVTGAFQKIKKENGYVDPSIASRQLAGEDHRLREKIKRGILRHPTEGYLHGGAIDVLQQLLAQGDHLTIWTDDYPWRVATSGLGILRSGLPAGERQRFSLAHAENKIELLPDLFAKASLNGLKKAIIVDNAKDNLEQATQVIKQENPGIKFSLVWINPDAPEIDLPASLTPEIPQRSMRSISELPKLRQVHQDAKDPLFWIIDFNHTLIDTDAYMAAVQDSIVHTLRQY